MLRHWDWILCSHPLILRLHWSPGPDVLGITINLISALIYSVFEFQYFVNNYKFNLGIDLQCFYVRIFFALLIVRVNKLYFNNYYFYLNFTCILYGINLSHNVALDRLFGISVESMCQIDIVARAKGENNVDVLKIK